MLPMMDAGGMGSSQDVMTRQDVMTGQNVSGGKGSGVGIDCQYGGKYGDIMVKDHNKQIETKVASS